MKDVAIGFRAHSGWAAYVAVAGPARSPAVVERGRIGLADPRIPPPFQPYHKAAEMPFKKAEEFIRRVTEQTRNFARAGIKKVIEELHAREMAAADCAVLVGAGRPLGELKTILDAHPLIHTAEGQLFRAALIHGAERCGLRAVSVIERELFSLAESELSLSREEIDRRLTGFGRALGPPWQQDQKFAALAAWLNL